MLKAKQLACLEMLTSGHSRVEISKKLNISESTIQRWQKLTEFKDALEGVAFAPSVISSVEVVNTHKSRRERLDRLVDASIDMLEQVITSEDCRCADRIRAAVVVGSWVGIDKKPDYEAALLLLSEYGWLSDNVTEIARQASIDFKGKVQKAIASDISTPVSKV